MKPKNLSSKTIKTVVVLWLLAFFICPLQAVQPRWWKGNLHMHSLWSDGRVYPEVAVDVYKKMGYNFISLTDHRCISQETRWRDIDSRYSTEAAYDYYVKRFGSGWVETREINGKKQVRLKPLNEFRHLFEEPKKFMLMQGEEITEYAHLNAVNIIDEVPDKNIKTTKDSIKFAVSTIDVQRQKYGQQMLLFLNHPNFRWHVKAEDFMCDANITFFELNDGMADECRKDDTRTTVERMWDIVLTQRLAKFNLPVLYGLRTDDTHFYFDPDEDDGTPASGAGRAWIMVRAKYLTPESIMSAMRAGDFYASTGAVLDDIKFDDKTFSVKIKHAEGVEYVTEFIGTLKGYDDNSSPVLDANGQELDTTRKYSGDIGKILKTVKGTEASYELTGKEIYVRAKISSEKKTKSGSSHLIGTAWTQPVIKKK